MSAISDLYDYFTPIEAAIQSVFDANSVVCWTPLSDQEFQKARPRVEAVLMPGGNKGMLLALAGRRSASGHMREKARRAVLDLKLITEADIITHRSFLAKVLFILDTLAFAMNATNQLPNHAIGGLICNGGDIAYAPEDGAYISHLTCDVDFSVKEAAWENLETDSDELVLT